MNLFKKPKYLLMILLASLTFVTFVPKFATAQVGVTDPATLLLNKTVADKVAPKLGAAAADTADWLAIQLGHIVYFFTIRLPSLILRLEILMFRWVGPYNNFTEQPQVANAWGTVRDLANMFFILVLLLMSFGTILQVQGYGYRQMLSKLLLMAILINFSKSMVAILIDLSQIVTLTFLAPVIDNLGGNIVAALGLSKIMALSNNNEPGYDGIAFLMAMILGGIMMIITTVIMGVILAMFVARIVAFWIMIILSPMAFLARAFPKMNYLYSQWEGELTKNLTLGPALAFFIWLAFSIVGQGNISSDFKGASNVDDLSQSGIASNTEEAGSFSTVVSKVAETSNMLNFVIAISLLMAGLKFASSSGAAGASMAGSASKSLQKWGSRVGRGATIGAAAGVGALAWRGTSGEGGIKGGLGQARGVVGQTLVKTGEAWGSGDLKRAGLSMQAKETSRRQRKQAKFDKRFEGMSDQQKLDYNQSLVSGIGFLGKREARANLAQDELRTTRGKIDPAKARAMQAAFERAGDITSLEKLGTRSAVVHKDGKSFKRMLDKNGDSALSNLNLEEAAQDVMDSVASLSEDVLIKGFEGMGKELREANMKTIDGTFTTNPAYTGARMGGLMTDENSAQYKARLLQAKYRGSNAEDNGLAASYNALAEADKQKFLRKIKLSGEDILKIEHNDPTHTNAATMFHDLAFRASQTQVASMVGAVPAGDTATLKLIAAAQAQAGNAKQARTVAGGVLAPHIEDGDVKKFVTRVAPTPPVGAPTAVKDAHTKKLRSLALSDLGHAHVVYPPATHRAPFIAFIETLSTEQLKQMDEDSLRLVKGACSASTQTKLTSIGI